MPLPDTPVNRMSRPGAAQLGGRVSGLGFTLGLARRQVVSRDIRRILTQRAYFFNIVLDDVSITQLTFSREYTSAVEAKQVAQQDSERAKFIVRLPRPAPWLARVCITLCEHASMDSMGHTG
jgi:hypothetical protein